MPDPLQTEEGEGQGGTRRSVEGMARIFKVEKYFRKKKVHVENHRDVSTHDCVPLLDTLFM